MMEAISKRRNSGEGGFTLVELLVVISILGILAAVAVFAVGGITNKGKGSACKASVSVVETAAEAAYANSDPSAYPVDMTALVASGFLKAAPTGSGYSIGYASGVTTATPACSTL